MIDSVAGPIVNSGVKLSNCGGIKLTTLLKSLPLDTITAQPDRLGGIKTCRFRSMSL
jgi:hypothetical protein